MTDVYVYPFFEICGKFVSVPHCADEPQGCVDLANQKVGKLS